MSRSADSQFGVRFQDHTRDGKTQGLTGLGSAVKLSGGRIGIL
jgi:hypothetical protein